MAQQSPFDDTLRPVAPQAKWWIVGIVFLVLGAWELAFHLWMMDLPMITGHRLNALIGAGLVAGVVLATFILIQRYEQRLAEAAASLREKNEALRSLEAERDTRLVSLAQDLVLGLVEINSQCEIALGASGPSHAAETLRIVKQRVDDLGATVRAIVEMKQDGSGLIHPLPAILEEHEKHRDEYLRKREWYLRYLKEHPGIAQFLASVDR
jgi:hypothetical protein